MKIEELLQHIQKAKEGINRVKDIASTCKEGEKWLPLLDKVITWLTEVDEDASNGRILEAYIQVVDSGVYPLTLDSGDISDKEILDNIQNGQVGEMNSTNKHHFSLLETFYRISVYHFYKQLGFALSNIVVVGANGCGKTSLANSISKALNVTDGIVIPAQKLLILPSYNSIPNYDTTNKEYQEYQHKIFDDKQTYNVSTNDDFPYAMSKQYGSEFKFIISTLIAEQVKKNNSYCKRIKNGENPNPKQLYSNLDTVFDIWNDLIANRNLTIDENNRLIITPDNGESYDAYKMSDGERVILYFAGRVLLAPYKALIVVDEPEGYLHESIISKLWNKLEYLRNDCVFIYLTHDLHFASSRRALKFWMKSFTYPDKWEISPIESNIIPEPLLMEILGSKKKILFCEGNRQNSLDIRCMR